MINEKADERTMREHNDKSNLSPNHTSFFLFIVLNHIFRDIATHKDIIIFNIFSFKYYLF